jgi:hypothetical protein
MRFYFMGQPVFSGSSQGQLTNPLQRGDTELSSGVLLRPNHVLSQSLWAILFGDPSGFARLILHSMPD